MRLSSYLPWSRIQLVWSQNAQIMSRSNLRTWQAWVLIPLLHLACLLDTITSHKPARGRAKLIDIRVDKPRE